MNVEKKDISEWLGTLTEAAAGQHYPKLFKRVKYLLSVPSRSRKAVTVFKISKLTKEGDNVLVPRKVLLSGKIDHKVNIAALEYSSSARKHLKESGCTILELKDMIGKNKINVII